MNTNSKKMAQVDQIDSRLTIYLVQFHKKLLWNIKEIDIYFIIFMSFVLVIFSNENSWTSLEIPIH